MENVSNLLKGFVISGGIALLAGSVLLVALLIGGRRGERPPDVRTAAAPVDVALPAGARVEQATMEGKHLVLLARDAAGRQLVIVLDLPSGRRVGLVRLRPEP